MARRTRQSTWGSQRNRASLEDIIGETTSTQVNAAGGQGIGNLTRPQSNLNGNGKCTSTHDNPGIPAIPEVQPTTPKRGLNNTVGDNGKDMRNAGGKEEEEDVLK
ncbi:hypothetical protein EDB87DRAFT_1580637 [Lactarius vividus]|nr:hypothetical protein EDB87DRAFT_1580637 [Lactarius vividus]